MGVNQRALIAMTDDEVAQFLDRSRIVTIGTIGPDGTPHLTAMWYAVLDGDIWFETKAKSQKAVNLGRDSRITCMVEDGLTYDKLRGVAIEGKAELIDDHDSLFRIARSVWERYTGPYSDDLAPAVEAMTNKRVAVRVRAERTRSWDHSKLGLPDLPIGGSTAEYL